ncbi:MAG: UPF0175 family protein [Turicibacter sp.]|nr:UPF0175 family protein [Turicibacter sp.]
MAGKIELAVPTEMIPFIPVNDSRMEKVQQAMLLYPYIKNETISHGKAAEILGISKMELIEIYSEMGIDYISMDYSEIEKEIATYQRLKGKRL